MGDAARFRLFADAVQSRFPDRRVKIADVASGRGGLHAALYMLGYQSVTSWDVRKKNATIRTGYHYGLFDYRNAPRKYDLVLGLHPDEATDQIIQYAVKHRKPFLVCPCCIKPSAVEFKGKGFGDWMGHLVGLAESGDMKVEWFDLPMRGRNRVIAGIPL